MFKRARLKLTGFYVLTIMFVSVMFSVVIYRVLVNEVLRFEQEQRSEIATKFKGAECITSDGLASQPPPPITSSPELVKKTENRVFFALILVNLGILGTATTLGYMLAGLTLQPIKEMVEEQNRFVSDASHELKTPLTSLKIAFEVYLRNKHRTLKEADEIITESVDEVDKLQSLSESLLQLAQYEKPNGHTLFEVVALQEVIKEAVRKVEPLAKKKKIRLISKLEKDLCTNGIKSSLKDLLVILLDNAVKYSNVHGEITVASYAKEDSVEVVVEDYGMGIAEEELPHIFDRFYRADTARSKVTKGGYGLGLSIAKKIIAMHHGKIKVESAVGKGARFIVVLPLHNITKNT